MQQTDYGCQMSTAAITRDTRVIFVRFLTSDDLNLWRFQMKTCTPIKPTSALGDVYINFGFPTTSCCQIRIS